MNFLQSLKTYHFKILRAYVKEHLHSTSHFTTFDAIVQSLVFLTAMIFFDSLYVNLIQHQEQSIFIPFIFMLIGIAYLAIDQFYRKKIKLLGKEFQYDEKKVMSWLNIKIENTQLNNLINEVKAGPIKKVKKV